MTARDANRRGEGDLLRADLVRAATDLLLAPQDLAVPLASAPQPWPSSMLGSVPGRLHLPAAVLDGKGEKVCRAAGIQQDRIAIAHQLGSVARDNHLFSGMFFVADREGGALEFCLLA